MWDVHSDQTTFVILPQATEIFCVRWEALAAIQKIYMPFNLALLPKLFICFPLTRFFLSSLTQKKSHPKLISMNVSVLLYFDSCLLVDFHTSNRFMSKIDYRIFNGLACKWSISNEHSICLRPVWHMHFYNLEDTLLDIGILFQIMRSSSNLRKLPVENFHTSRNSHDEARIKNLCWIILSVRLH